MRERREDALIFFLIQLGVEITIILYNIYYISGSVFLSGSIVSYVYFTID